MEKTIQLLPQQDEYIFSEAKFPAVVGTWGCGKSLASLFAVDQECKKYPNNLYLIIRKEYVDLRDSTMNDWRDLIGRPITGDKESVYPNGSKVMFRHGDDLNALVNTNLGGSLMIQAEEMLAEDLWFLFGRNRRNGCPGRIRIEANYAGHNWIWKYWKQKDIKIPDNIKPLITINDFHLVEMNTMMNAKNLKPEYIASLQLLPERLRRVHFEGSWDYAEGLIWPEFDEKYHIITPFTIPNWWEHGAGLDTAVGAGTTAGLTFAVDPDGNIIITGEYYRAKRIVSEHASGLKELNYSGSWIADPSAFNKTREKGGILYSVADEYRDNGITLTPGQSDVAAGINRVAEYLKVNPGQHPYHVDLSVTPKLFIFRNCVNLISELTTYRWAELKPGQLGEKEPKPYKEQDHAVDTLRYIIMSRPQIRKEKPAPPIKPGSVAWEMMQDEITDNWRDKF